MSYIKEVISLVWFTAVLTSAHADDGYNLGFEAKFDMLSAQMRQLEKQNTEMAKQNFDMSKQISELAKQNSELAEQNSELEIQTLQLKENDSELERKITNMQTKANSSTSLMFDCYLTSDWSFQGPIRFSGCTVDLTTGDPWSGTFVVPESGWWRFTFNPYVIRQAGSSSSAYNLLIDGIIAARSYTDLNYDLMLPMNTIQVVNAGQSVTIEWTDTGAINGNSNKYSHFTGEYLGNTGPTPPECEFPGQTFQYPGSCRQYWLCQTDGTVDIMDCCPDVYLPDADACVSEDLVIVDSICHSEDTCA